jgi:uncharacterized protein
VEQPQERCENSSMAADRSFQLTAAEARVLGALMEKEVTTPEYYPLSLNALINACNQKSNREPVMELDEEAARQALHGLEDDGLAGRAREADGRVTKYEHRLGEAFNFSRAEAALVCVLLLRGPQTPGELRGRTERMHRFEEISDVLAGLQKLMEREPPLAAVLPRQPGTKEARYAHLLGGDVEIFSATTQAQTLSFPRSHNRDLGHPAFEFAQGEIRAEGSDDERIARLEGAVRELQREIVELKKKFEDLFA